MSTKLNVYYCMWCGSVFDTYPEKGECSNCKKKSLQHVGKYVETNQHFEQIIKISSLEVINSMRNGELWFQSPKYFQEYSGEGQKVRADVHDARYVYRYKNGDYVEDTNANTYRILCFILFN